MLLAVVGILGSHNPAGCDRAAVAARIASGNCSVPPTSGELLATLRRNYGPIDTSPGQWAAQRNIPDAPINVTVFSSLVQLVSVDMKRQQVKLALWVSYGWSDPRLAWATSDDDESSCWCGSQWLSSQGSPIGSFWTPSVYAENWVKRPDDPGPLQQTYYIDSSGQITWSRKEEWTVSCGMDFTNMPYDRQHCVLRLKTYTEGVSEVLLDFHPHREPITILDGPSALPGELEWKPLIEPNRSKTRAWVLGSYPALDMAFVLERVPHYYETNVITNACILVIIAYSAFFVSRAAVPARVALSIITVLATFGLLNSVNTMLPRGPHVVWLVTFLRGSLLFIVSATVEYTVVNYLLRSQARIEKVVAKIKASKKADVGSPDVQAVPPLRPEATAVQVEAIDVEGEVSGTLRAEALPQLAKIDRLLVRADGTMRCKDEHLEVAARWLYPVAYSIFFGVHYASLPPAEQR